MKSKLDVIALVASISSALATIAAAFLIYQQIDESTRLQRETVARQFLMDYLKYGADNPKFVCPRNEEEILNSPDFFAYASYVSYTLRTLESAVTFIENENKSEWDGVVLEKLPCHAKFLASRQFLISNTYTPSYCTYSRKMRQLILVDLQRQKIPEPKCAG